MRTHGTKIKCPCVFSTHSPGGEIKCLLRSKYLWFPRLHALLLSENNSWKPEGTFIHQHSFASSGMKDKVASPDYVLLIISLLSPKIVHQKSISEAQFPENIKLEIFFHYFLSCLKSVCPPSCPQDPSMAEMHKQVFSYSLSSSIYMLTGIEIQHHRHLVDIVTSDASVLTLYSYFPTLIFQ